MDLPTRRLLLSIAAAAAGRKDQAPASTARRRSRTAKPVACSSASSARAGLPAGRLLLSIPWRRPPQEDQARQKLSGTAEIAAQHGYSHFIRPAVTRWSSLKKTMTGIANVNYHKKIICLATSRKLGGRCIAGKEVLRSGYGPWIRPVSVRPTAEIEFTERQYKDGTEPKLLDIISIPMLAPAPRLHQTENHVIDARFYWEKEGTLPWDDLGGMLDGPPTLWANEDSSKGGRNDRVSETTAGALTTSLFLIKPDNPTIQVAAPGAIFNNPKRKVRADFYYKGVQYNFGMTDPGAERVFLAQENGDYKLKQDTYFCISLAETPFEGNYYKLVASIITKAPL